MSTNLWGNLDDLSGKRTPVSILKEQASFLTEGTSGVLRGEVSSANKGEDFAYDLNIVAPALNDYNYTIAQITHGIELYPVTILSSAVSIS